MPVKTTQRGVNERSARKIRRENVIRRLEAQLKSGVKQARGTVLTLDKIPLTESDVKRIKKELEVLKSRV